MRNLNDDLNKVKAETASVMAEETRAKRELDECQRDVNKMLEYAKRAVDAGNDDDARAFLTKKVSLSEKLSALNTKYEAAPVSYTQLEDVNLDLLYVRCHDNKNYERLIPIGRSAEAALREYLSIRDIIASAGVHNLFVNLNGNQLTRQGVWRIVKEYSHKAGINKDVNLNTFRHSFAVHLLQNGANVRAVQKLLGNQVLTYMDTYYEIINNDKINLVYKNSHPRA